MSDDANMPDPALEAKVRHVVRAMEDERYDCTTAGLSPLTLDALIRNLRPDGKLGIGQHIMLKVLHHYGPEGLEHGRADLEQYVSKLLRVMDEETDIDPARDMSGHQQHYFRHGELGEMTRRRFWSVLTGLCGAGFALSGGIDLLAGKDVTPGAPARTQDPWTARIKKVQAEKERLMSPPVELGIGLVVLNDAAKEWDRAKVELLTEKLKDVAAMVDKFAVEVDKVAEQSAAAR